MNDLLTFLKQYKWRVITVCTGIVIAILLFTIGLWRTLLLSAIIAAGYMVGKKLDKDGTESFDEAVSKLFKK